MAKSIIEQLDQFMQQEYSKNAWLKSRGIIAYVRHNNRYVNNKFVSAFTLANVSTSSLKISTKTGRLRPVLIWMESLLDSNTVDAIIVESVVSERMTEILEKNSWTKLDQSEAPSWIKIKNSN